MFESLDYFLLIDLGDNPDFYKVRSEMEELLRSICDPEDIDLKAKSDQHDIIEANGGESEVLSKGGFGATPPPGVNPDFASTNRS